MRLALSIRPDLLAEIRSALGGAIAPNLTAKSQGADLYEAYIWSLVVQAAQSLGAAISFWDVHGNRVRADFVFRTSPGYIFSTARPYSHALISFENCPDLEAHVGIFVVGKSKVAPECDVAVLFSDEAYTCRQQNAHPRSSQFKPNDFQSIEPQSLLEKTQTDMPDIRTFPHMGARPHIARSDEPQTRMDPMASTLPDLSAIKPPDRNFAPHRSE